MREKNIFLLCSFLHIALYIANCWGNLLFIIESVVDDRAVVGHVHCQVELVQLQVLHSDLQQQVFIKDTVG
jgi:hypothetical protein